MAGTALRPLAAGLSSPAFCTFALPLMAQRAACIAGSRSGWAPAPAPAAASGRRCAPVAAAAAAGSAPNTGGATPSSSQPRARSRAAPGRGSASAPGAPGLKSRFSRRRAPSTPVAPAPPLEQPAKQQSNAPKRELFAAPQQPPGAAPADWFAAGSSSGGATASPSDNVQQGSNSSSPVARGDSSSSGGGGGSGASSSTTVPAVGSGSSSANGSSSSGSSGSGGGSSSSSAVGSVKDELARLSPNQIRQLEDYLDYMLEINQSMNLTAIRERSEAWARHIEDSLALLPVIEAHCPRATSAGNGVTSDSSSNTSSTNSSSGGFSVIDVGTGAGLPGMVLAIARPHWDVTLLDSLRKRCGFLEAAAARVGASNVSVVWARAEEGGRRPELRDRFDLAVARAVAAAPVLAELCMPFVVPGGTWVAAKGAAPEEEAAVAARAAAALGGGPGGIRMFMVDSWAPEGQRTALVVQKARPTPAAYPRAPGTPNKKPLGADKR